MLRDDAPVLKAVVELPKTPHEIAEARIFEGAVTEDVEEFKHKLAGTQYLVSGFIASNQLTHIFAPSGSGKTLLLMHWLLSDAVISTHRPIWYLNLDDFPQSLADKGDAIVAHESQIRMTHGKDPDDLVDALLGMAERGELKDVVIVFDTIKKFVESMIDKRELSRLYKKLRKLTNAGATVITLGHANKKREEHTGEPVFEGTEDVISDTDTCFSMRRLGDKADEKQFVQIKCLKSRGVVAESTVWTFTKPTKADGAYASMLGSVKFLDAKETARLLADDEETQLLAKYSHQIKFIVSTLRQGEKTQSELVETHKDQSVNWNFGRDNLKRALHDLDGLVVTGRRVRTNNTLYWKLIGGGDAF